MMSLLGRAHGVTVWVCYLWSLASLSLSLSVLRCFLGRFLIFTLILSIPVSTSFDYSKKKKAFTFTVKVPSLFVDVCFETLRSQKGIHGGSKTF